ncbi:MAG: manganese transport protein [Chloroflexota bacterium]|nr:manganese transport protein [Chloroflexota bacterium]
MKVITRTEPGLAEHALPGESRVLAAAQRSLNQESRGLRALWPFLGPAFVAAVAYVDPGNFATNTSAGAKYGYMLLWVVLSANLMAMLIQSMSAKLGIATGRNLAEVCRDRFPRPLSWGLWVQAELVAMATDLAEFVGAAVGLNLLFGIPLLPAGVIIGFAAFGILTLQSRGFRPLEAAIAALVGVIVVAFGFEVFLSGFTPSEVVHGLFVPRIQGTDSVLLAVGILGATVMPHVIYLHSALTQNRVVGVDAREREKIFKLEKIDVVIAMSIAGLVNIAMMVTAAAVFFGHDVGTPEDLDGAFHGLGQAIGSHASVAFGLALLASGLSSSSVGTMAGQVVMQGFIRRRIPLLLRRLVTMTPALVVLAIGVNPSTTLVLSQVALSFGIPFALIPLVIFCSNRGLMDTLVNRRATTIVAWAVVAVIVSLNGFLVFQVITGA